jgi:hypothetical protein
LIPGRSRKRRGRASVRRYIAEGRLDAVRLGRKTLRIKVESIERLIECPAGRGLAGLRAKKERPEVAAPCSPHVPDFGSRSGNHAVICGNVVGDTGFEPVTSSV